MNADPMVKRTFQVKGTLLRCNFSVMCLAFLLVSATCARAQENARSDDRPRLIDIKLESTRKQPAAGSGLGISAEIRNRSSEMVYLYPKQVTLVPPPELRGPTNTANAWDYEAWYAFFPTEVLTNGEKFDRWIGIKPDHSYKVFFAPYPETMNSGIYASGIQHSNAWEALKDYVKRGLKSSKSNLGMDFLFFSPGEYKLDVVAKYWTNPPAEFEAPSKPEDIAYHTAVESLTLSIVAPQSVILWGAAVGGVMAYFLLPNKRERVNKHMEATANTVFTWKPSLKWVQKVGIRILLESYGGAGAILLSVMITILLSRISETQFVIHVNVNDFWGAVVIGFVANYLGTEALDKILKKFSTQHSSVAPTDSHPER